MLNFKGFTLLKEMLPSASDLQCLNTALPRASVLPCVEAQLSMASLFSSRPCTFHAPGRRSKAELLLTRIWAAAPHLSCSFPDQQRLCVHRQKACLLADMQGLCSCLRSQQEENRKGGKHYDTVTISKTPVLFSFLQVILSYSNYLCAQ